MRTLEKRAGVSHSQSTIAQKRLEHYWLPPEVVSPFKIFEMKHLLYGTRLCKSLSSSFVTPGVLIAYHQFAQHDGLVSDPPEIPIAEVQQGRDPLAFQTRRH